MKRVLFILAGLLAVALLTLPWFAGVQAQARYDRFLSELEQNGARVVNSEYRQGWFGSDATTELELSPGKADASWPVRLESRIEHGPLPLDELFGGAPMWARIYTRVSAPATGVDGNTPLQAVTRVDLDGELETSVRIPDQERDGVKVEGVGGRFRFGTSGGLQGTLRAPMLVVEKKGSPALQLRDLDLSIDMAPGAGGMQLGQLNLGLGQLEVRNPRAAGPVVLTGLRVDIDSGAENGQVFLHADYGFEELDVAGDAYRDAGLHVALDRLPAAVLARMRNGLQALKSREMAPAQRNFAVMGVLMGNLQPLLADDPRLGLERFHLTTPEGEVDGRFVLQVKGLPAGLSNPMLLLSYLDGEAELAMPETLLRNQLAAQMRAAVEMELAKRRQVNGEVKAPGEAELKKRIDSQVEEQIQKLLGQEFAVRDGTRLRSSARLSSGLLTVNGKTIPLPMLGLTQ